MRAYGVFLFWSLLCLLLVGCSGLSTLKSYKKNSGKIEGNKFHFTSMMCTPLKCEMGKSSLHELLATDLRSLLNKWGYQEITKDKADVGIIIVSTFEKEIVHTAPRNIYLIVNAKEKERGFLEVAQLGISRPFSDPLTEEYGALSEVSYEVQRFLIEAGEGRFPASFFVVQDKLE